MFTVTWPAKKLLENLDKNVYAWDGSWCGKNQNTLANASITNSPVTAAGEAPLPFSPGGGRELWYNSGILKMKGF